MDNELGYMSKEETEKYEKSVDKLFKPIINKINEKRFQNITLYKNCPYENIGKQIDKMDEEDTEMYLALAEFLKDPSDAKLEHLIEEIFDSMQTRDTLLENISRNISEDNKKHIEKMISRYEK